MTWTYRDKLNEKIDEQWIFTTRKKEWLIRLDRWFYITKDLYLSLKYRWLVPLEEYHSPNMWLFANMNQISRQAVRDSIIVNWKFIFIRKWYYNKERLIVFLFEFMNRTIW